MDYDSADPVSFHGQLSARALRRAAEQAAQGNRQYLGSGHAYHSPVGHVYAQPPAAAAVATGITVRNTEGSLIIPSCTTLNVNNLTGGLFLTGGSGTAQVAVNLHNGASYPSSTNDIPDTTFAEIGLGTTRMTLPYAGTYLLYANLFLDAQLDPTATKGAVFFRFASDSVGIQGSVIQDTNSSQAPWQKTLVIAPVVYTSPQDNQTVLVQGYKKVSTGYGPYTTCRLHSDGIGSGTDAGDAVNVSCMVGYVQIAL
ncbi:MAG: hypothetical protein V4597_11680 [Pseudomonadota bacterium]